MQLANFGRIAIPSPRFDNDERRGMKSGIPHANTSALFPGQRAHVDYLVNLLSQEKSHACILCCTIDLYFNRAISNYSIFFFFLSLCYGK